MSTTKIIFIMEGINNQKTENQSRNSDTLVFLFLGVGVLAYLGHEDLAKTIGGAILLIIAGAFGGYGVGKKGS